MLAATADFVAGATCALAGVFLMMIFYLIGDWIENRRRR